MTYEEVKSVDANIKIKNDADIIYQNFLNNVKFEVKNYKGTGRFLFWDDGNNQTYFKITNDTFYYECDFLHEKYCVEVTPSGIFRALVNDNKGVDHLISAVRDKGKDN